MRFVCPNCAREVKLSQTECPNPQCQFRLTLGAILLFYGRRARARLQEIAVTPCPQCHQTIPIWAKTCPDCGVASTVGLATTATLAPVRRWWHHLPPPFWRWLRRIVQALYLALSAVLFWRLLGTVDAYDLWALALRAVLTAFFAAVLALLALWLVPRRLRAGLFQRTAPLTRVALVLNALALLLLLQTLIHQWWALALIVAGLFGVVCLAAALFAKLLWPRVAEVRKILHEARPGSFDPSQPQGRQASSD